MGEFFKGWRRKTGCVALLMACAFMVIWLRNLANPALIGLPTNDGYRWVSSSDGYYSNWTYQSNGQWQYMNIFVPHWSLVISLTLLSAYLILWKPRKRERVVNSAQ